MGKNKHTKTKSMGVSKSHNKHKESKLIELAEFYNKKEKIELIETWEFEWLMVGWHPEQISYVQPFVMSEISESAILRFTQDQVNALTEEQIAALRQNQFLQRIDQVLKLYRVNPAFIRLFSDEELQFIENQMKALRTENQMKALSNSMQELNVDPTSPRERASSWTEVVAEGTEIIEKGLGKS